MSAEQSLSRTCGCRDGVSCPASPEGHRVLWVRGVALEWKNPIPAVPCPELGLVYWTRNFLGPFSGPGSLCRSLWSIECGFPWPTGFGPAATWRLFVASIGWAGQVCCFSLALVMASRRGLSVCCACTENRTRLCPSADEWRLDPCLSHSKMKCSETIWMENQSACTYGEGKKSSLICRQATISNLSFVKDLIYTRTPYLPALADPLLPFLSTVPTTQLLFVSEKRKETL